MRRMAKVPRGTGKRLDRPRPLAGLVLGVDFDVDVKHLKQLGADPEPGQVTPAHNVEDQGQDRQDDDASDLEGQHDSTLPRPSHPGPFH